MSKLETKTNNTPTLRFPEFSGEWDEKKFGYVFKRVLRKNKENNLNVLTISAQKGLVSQEEYFLRSVSAKDVTGYYLLHKREFAYNKSYSKGYPMGAIKRLNKYPKGVVSTLYICFDLIDKANNGEFFEQYLDDGNINYEIGKVAQEGARNHGLLNITPNDFFEQIKIKFPKPAEQQKIASFLTSIDDWIENLKKQKELQEKYKKGLMQKIFSQELRFKDENGDAYPEWEERRLGEIGEVIGGGTPDTNVLNYWNGEINWFTPTEIKQKYVYDSLRMISERGLKSSSARLLPEGTLLLTTRATIADVSIAQKECSTNQGFQSLIINNENLNTFFYYWIIYNKKEFIRKANGSTFTEISGNEVKKIKCIKPFLKEQEKIADFLSSIDDLINLSNQCIILAEYWKKGLMQRMFV